MKKSTHIIAVFYVSLILLFKVTSLHALVHHEVASHAQHCEACHISTIINCIPLLETDSTLSKVTTYFFVEKQIIDKTLFVPFNNRHFSNYLFARPPPHFS